MLFVSYRRSDCLAASGRLLDALAHRYGSRRVVFRDYDALEPGAPWPDQLRQALADSSAVLALIGTGWDSERLDNPADWVRLEIEAGYRGRKLFPLLVDGASVPARLNALCPPGADGDLQAWPLRNDLNFAADLERICAKLEERYPPLKELAAFRRGRFRLPGVASHFVGREKEIADLKAALLNGGRAGVSALKGMGGVGKTTLAVKVATELKGEFDDGVFVLDLMGTGTAKSPLELMREVIRLYRPTEPPADDATAPAIFAGVLAGQRVLILMDNASNAAQVKPLLKAAPPTVGFLITSRNTLKLDIFTPVALDALPLPDAVKLLRDLAKRGTDTELEDVAKVCGRLPLALRIAGDFLGQNPHWTTAKYIAALAAQPLERLADEDDDERNVRAVLQFSLDLLAKQKPEVAARYGLLCVFPADFDEKAAQAVLAVDETTWLDTATVLRDRSLIDYEKGRYRVHDLLRLLAGNLLASRDREGAGSLYAAEVRFAQHYRDVQAECERLYMAGHDSVAVGLRLFDTEAGNIAYGRNRCRICWEQMRGHDIGELIIRYALNAQFVHDMRLSPDDRRSLLDVALPVSEASGLRSDVASIQFRLAMVHQTRGDFDEAITLLQNAVAIAKETADAMGQAVFSGVIADILQSRGQLDEALRIRREEELPVYERLGDVRSKAVTMGKIADILQAQDQLDEALRIRREEELPVYERLGDVRSKAVTSRKIADILQAKGDLSTALNMLQDQALKPILGMGMIADEAAFRGRIADIFKAQGQLDEALRIRCDECMPVYQRLGDVRGEIMCRVNIASVLQKRNHPGDRAEAVEHLRWALAEAERMQLAEVPTIRVWLARAEGG